MNTFDLNVARIAMSISFKQPVIVLSPHYGSGKYYAATKAMESIGPYVQMDFDCSRYYQMHS